MTVADAGDTFGPVTAKRKDWPAALEAIRDVIDLRPFDDILAVAARRPEMLSGLG